MPVDVVMPQMGESIAEGTVTRWMKKVGDPVERDEPLFEISTDKVDAEIPSPAAGVLTEILAEEGKTVAVNSVVARLGTSGEAAGASTEPDTAGPAPATAGPEADAANRPPDIPSEKGATPSAPPGAEQQAANAAVADEVAADASGASADVPGAMAEPKSAESPAAAETNAGTSSPEESATPGEGGTMSVEERRRTRSSPLVRKIAEENKVDISSISGTGVSGRVTKNDILQFIQSPRPQTQAPAGSTGGQTAASAPAGSRDRVQPLSVMRRRIADHMVMSKATSAHVTTLFEVDFTAVDKLRRKHKQSFADKGVSLTFLPFIIQAVTAGVREFPVLNASLDGDNVIYRGELNLGIAVALEWGLIVPVIKSADEKNILGLARAINDLGERARTKKLNPEDVQGGTFTITNPGVYGGLFGTPIINQPQVAIMGVGGIKKRAVVIETPEGDAIVIRSMAYLALSFDHRLIDGAVADQFMAKVKAVLEKGEFQL